jgi:hypothetical protein
MYTALHWPLSGWPALNPCEAMKLFLLYIAVFMGQSQTAQNGIVRLPAHTSKIPVSDGGKTVELLDAPPIVYLPQRPPHMSFNGVPWYVDVKNLGPSSVTLQGVNNFTVHLSPNGTVHVRTISTGYTSTGR